MTDVFIKHPKRHYNESSSGSVTAYFRDSSNAAEIPTTAQYRVDCLTTAKQLQDWTSLTPAISISIPITSTHNYIQTDSNDWELKQMTVAANKGTSTQTIDTVQWKVKNIRGWKTT